MRKQIRSGKAILTVSGSKLESGFIEHSTYTNLRSVRHLLTVTREGSAELSVKALGREIFRLTREKNGNWIATDTKITDLNSASVPETGL